MDIERPDLKKAKRKRRIFYAVIGSGLLATAWVGLSQLEPAVPSLDQGSVWVDTVKRGPLLREVRGIGVLAPEENRLISAQTTGRVERLLIFPGTRVEIDTVILVMNNPQLEQEVENARLELRASETELVSIEVELEGRMLEMEANHAQLEANYQQALLEAELNEELFTEGLVAELAFKRSELNAEQLGKRVALDLRRIEFQGKSQQSRLDTQQAQIEQLQARYNLLTSQLEAQQVRAGIEGVLQRLPVEIGQQVAPGEILAEVADPSRLKAVVEIAETQAKDVMPGQTARIDTRNGIIEGVVMRVDPTVENGTVAVDVRLISELPRGARPDLTIEGNIELERLADVIYVGRPAFAREYGSMEIYRFESEGTFAVRTPVNFGLSSVSDIEVSNGLTPGDRVILSDTSEWAEHPRIKIK